SHTSFGIFDEVRIARASAQSLAKLIVYFACPGQPHGSSISTPRTTRFAARFADVENTARRSPGHTSPCVSMFHVVYVPFQAALRSVERSSSAAAAFSQSCELRGAGLATVPIHAAVPGRLPPRLSSATLAASACRATERPLIRYETAISSPAFGITVG